jgi:hypothetical protein
MLIKIRFGRGASITRRQGKNARMAVAASTCGTLAAISCGTLGGWRLGQDLGWAGDFVFESGVLSHWQVWLSAAALLQYGSWKLSRYGRAARELPSATGQTTERPERVSAAVNS